MHEKVGYIIKLIANYCYKGLSHNVLRPTGVNLFTFCSLRDINVLLRTFIVRHGDVLSVVIERHFQLLRVRDAHLCVNGSPEWCFSFAHASCLVATCHSNLGNTLIERTYSTTQINLRPMQRDNKCACKRSAFTFRDAMGNVIFFSLSHLQLGKFSAFDFKCQPTAYTCMLIRCGNLFFWLSVSHQLQLLGRHAALAWSRPKDQLNLFKTHTDSFGYWV